MFVFPKGHYLQPIHNHDFKETLKDPIINFSCWERNSQRKFLYEKLPSEKYKEIFFALEADLSIIDILRQLEQKQIYNICDDVSRHYMRNIQTAHVTYFIGSTQYFVKFETVYDMDNTSAAELAELAMFVRTKQWPSKEQLEKVHTVVSGSNARVHNNFGG